MTALDYALLAFAVWRITLLIGQEDGPFDIFLRFRRLSGVQYYDSGEEVDPQVGYLPKLLTCPWCLSVMVALASWGLWLAWPATTILLAIPFALSGGAMLINSIARRQS